MPLSGSTALFKALLAGVLLAASLAGGALASPMPPDQFPLGQSCQTGVVCQAVRNLDAPAAQIRGARAWDISCRGFDTPLGALYRYDFKGPTVIGTGGLWAKALAKKARCADLKPVTFTGMGSSSRSDCQMLQPAVAYTAYRSLAHGHAFTAEGYGQIADVLETGLKVMAGSIPPPKATETLAASSVQEAS